MEDKERQGEKKENKEPQDQYAKKKQRAEVKFFFLNESVFFFQNPRRKW